MQNLGVKKRNSGNQELSNEPEKDTIMEGDEAEEEEQNSSSDESSKTIDNEQSDAEEEDDDEEDDDDDEEEEEDDDFPRKKKSKNSKHDDGSTGFSAAVNAILSSHLKAYDRKDPIMARNKKVLKQSESEKLEYKAKKSIVGRKKKKLLGKARKTDIIPIASGEDRSENIRKVLEKETALRKIAQKGAVKLFNAILATQVKTEKEVSENLSGIKNKEEKKELITEVSKEKFLDLVKAAAGSDNE